jgi:hypothetical protein
MQSGAVLNNEGVFDFQESASIVYNGGTLPTFNNTSTGTVQVAAGKTATIGGNIAFVQNGTLTGDGAFTISALTNAGHVKPGDGIGELTINGNYTQNALGVLDIQITSLASFDLLSINGTAALDGMLALSCLGACSMAIGDEIVILDSTGNLTGTFLGGVSLSGFATGAFDVVYDDVNDLVLLRVTDTVTAVPEAETWAMLLVGLGLVGFAARRKQG